MREELRTKETVQDGIIDFKFGDDGGRGQSLVRYVEYEPGNGTKYRLLFTNISGVKLEEVKERRGVRSGWVVTNLSSMRSIIVTDTNEPLHFNYVTEQFKCGLADGICLAEIIGHCTQRSYYTSEEALHQLQMTG